MYKVKINEELAQRLDEFIKENPGVSYTLVINQALKAWLENPQVEVIKQAFTDADADKFMDANKQLMADLSAED